MRERIQKILKTLSIKFIVIAVLFIIALFVFGYIIDEVIFENEDGFDFRVLHLFRSYSSEGLIRLSRFFSFFGSSIFFIPAYVTLCIFLFVKRKKTDAIHIGLIALTSSALLFTLKAAFHRKRPEGAVLKLLHTYSFPSGHALSSFIFCSILIYLIWNGAMKTGWKWVLSVLLLLFSLTIGLSRIMLGVHYASDVIAGFCLGFVWVTFSLWLLNKINKNKEQIVE